VIIGPVSAAPREIVQPMFEVSWMSAPVKTSPSSSATSKTSVMVAAPARLAAAAASGSAANQAVPEAVSTLAAAARSAPPLSIAQPGWAIPTRESTPLP